MSTPMSVTHFFVSQILIVETPIKIYREPYIWGIWAGENPQIMSERFDKYDDEENMTELADLLVREHQLTFLNNAWTINQRRFESGVMAGADGTIVRVKKINFRSEVILAQGIIRSMNRLNIKPEALSAPAFLPVDIQTPNNKVRVASNS